MSFTPARLQIAGFAVAVLFQVGFLSAHSGATSDNPFGMMVAAALIAPFVLLLLLLWPHAGLLAVPPVLLIPLWFMGVSIAEWLLLVAIFVGGLRSLASRELPGRISSFEWVYFLFVAWTLLTMIQVIDMQSALNGMKRILVLFLTFLAGRRLLGSVNARVLLRVIALLGLLIWIQLLLLVVIKGFSVAALITRFGALTDLGWGTSNYVAAVATLTTAASIPLALHGRSWDRVLGLTGLVSAVLVSIVTTSRGGTLALALGLLVAAALEARRRFLLVSGLLVLAAASYLVSPLGQASLVRFVSPRDMPSVAARVVYFNDTFGIFRENLVFGVGPDQIPKHTSLIEYGPFPHNFLLKFGADHGVIGLFLYVSILAFAAARSWKLLRAASDREERVLGLAFVLVVFIGTINALYEPTIEAVLYGGLFWLMVGTLSSVAPGRIAKKALS